VHQKSAQPWMIAELSGQIHDLRLPCPLSCCPPSEVLSAVSPACFLFALCGKPCEHGYEALRSAPRAANCQRPHAPCGSAYGGPSLRQGAHPCVDVPWSIRSVAGMEAVQHEDGEINQTRECGWVRSTTSSLRQSGTTTDPQCWPRCGTNAHEHRWPVLRGKAKASDAVGPAMERANEARVAEARATKARAPRVTEGSLESANSRDKCVQKAARCWNWKSVNGADEGQEQQSLLATQHTPRTHQTPKKENQ